MFRFVLRLVPYQESRVIYKSRVSEIQSKYYFLIC